MSDISTQDWFSNLGTTVQPVFNSTAMGTLTPADVIFGAAEAYRTAQEVYNAGTSINPGEFINFASLIREDPLPSIDAAGELSKSREITLRAKVIYLPELGMSPQNSTTII